MPTRLAIIGLHQPEYAAIRPSHFGPVVHHELLPKIAVHGGKLFVDRTSGPGMVEVDRVVYYGIYENDLDFIAGLALWGGPCFPNPQAMLDCRLKIPCLIRALRYSKFAGPWRGYLSPGATIEPVSELVGKWGNWHCGQNKSRIIGTFTSDESVQLEPYFKGEAVRIVLIGDTYWQIRAAGETWLKSIENDGAAFMPVDPELLEDSRRIRNGLGLDFLGNDYIVSPDGKKYLLEVNHIPNVTHFEQLRTAYLNEVTRFITE